jgi:hypothetical protein
MNADLRAYRAANRAMLAFVLASVAFCFAVLLLGRAWPGHFTLCASMRFFSVPCPLCGATRGLNALLHGDPCQATAFNALTIPIAILLVIEVVYRLFGSFARIPARFVPGLRRADVRLHAAGFAIYILIAIAFYLRLLVAEKL